MDWQIIVYIMLNGSTWTEYQTGITSGSMSLEKSIVQGDIAFGAIYASMFSCQLYMTEEDLVGKKIKVVKRQGSTDETIFMGMIDSSTTDYSGTYRDIVAYDGFYFERDKNLAEWWNSFWSNRQSATIKQIREGCCTAAGFSFVSRTLTNDSVSVTKSEAGTFTKVSFEEILHAVSEATATFPIINGDGAIDWIFFSSTSSEIGADEIETAESQYQDFVTDKIDSVTLQDTETNIMQYVGVANGNPYAVVGNFLITSLSAAKVTTVCTAILNKIKDLSFNPCTVKLIYPLWGLHLGDKITTPHGTSYVMSCSYSDIQLLQESISAYASAQRNEKTSRNYNSAIISGRKFSVIKNDIDSISLSVGKVIDDETGEIKSADIIAAINDDESSIRISADKVVLDGLVTFENLENSGETVINGSNITTGVITDGGNDPNFTLDLTNGTLNIKQLTTIAERVDNFKIGTKNILQGTAKMEGSSTWARDKFYKRGTGTVTFEYDLADSPVTGVNKGVLLTPTQADTTVGIAQLGSEIRGETMTLSVFVKGTAGDKIILRCFWGTSSSDSSGDKTLTIDQTGVWERKVFTSNIAPPNPGYAYYIGYVYFKSSTVGHSCVICAPMLEYGTVPSDWGAAEEDVYKDYRSEIDQTADSITATVSANQTILNLLPTVYHTESVRSNPHVNAGITWTLNADGSVTAKGKATQGTNSIYHFVAGAFADDNHNAYDVQPLSIDTTKRYTLSGCPPTGSSSTYRMMARLYPHGVSPNWYNNGGYIIDTGTGATTGDGTTSEETGYEYAYVYAIIYGGYETPEDGITFHPMFEVGDTKHGYQSTHNGTNAMKSQIKQTADSITQTVSNTYQTKADSPYINLLPAVYYRENLAGQTYTYNGVTWTLQADGTVIATGKAVGGGSSYAFTGTTKTAEIPVVKIDPTKKYTVSGCPSGAVDGTDVKFRLNTRFYTASQTPNGTSNGTPYEDVGSGVTTSTGYTYCLVYATVYENTELPSGGKKFSPMLEVGDTKHEYQSTHNGTRALTSRIEQTADKIKLVVGGTAGNYSINAAEIMLAVNQTTGESMVSLDADHLDLNGKTINLTSRNFSLTTTSKTFSVTAEGVITAKSGNIGGFTIDATSVRSGTLTSTSAGAVALTNANFTRSINGTSRSNLRLAIGSKFGVASDGTVYASSATISGAITATSLTLGNGVTIPYSKLDGSPDLTVYIYKDGLIGSTPAEGATGFKVSSAGLLQASNAVIYGTLYSSSGKIGGWTIGSNVIKKEPTIDNKNYNVGIFAPATPSATSAAFYVQNVTDGYYPFLVRYNGSLHAIGGGTIGAWTLSEGGASSSSQSQGALYSGMSSLSSTSNGVYLGYDGIALGGGKFKVTRAGALNATSATISGDITATSGTIGGWSIGGLTLSKTYELSSGTTYLTQIGGNPNPNNTALLVRHYPTSDSSDYTNDFYVLWNGKLYANNADIAGKITTSEGEIAGWKIGTSKIEKTFTDAGGTEYQAFIQTGSAGTHRAFGVQTKASGASSYTMQFHARYDGKVFARNAEIVGNSKVAGWDVTNTYIQKYSAYTPGTASSRVNYAGLYAPESPTTGTYAFQVAYAAYDGANFGAWSTPFYVTYGGKLHAENAEITGNITANSLNISDATITGRITANNIDATSLHVSAANIDGTIAANKVDAANLEVQAAKIQNLTVGVINGATAYATADGNNAFRIGSWKAYASGASLTFGRTDTTGWVRFYPSGKTVTSYSTSPTVTYTAFMTWYNGTYYRGLCSDGNIYRLAIDW